jgi:hypothetical protein
MVGDNESADFPPVDNKEVALRKVENRGSILAQNQRPFLVKYFIDTLTKTTEVCTYSIAVK